MTQSTSIHRRTANVTNRSVPAPISVSFLNSVIEVSAAVPACRYIRVTHPTPHGHAARYSDND